MNSETPGVVSAAVMAALRSLLMAGGASLVTAGVMTGAQESDMVGAVLVIGAFAWSQVQKLYAHKALTDARSGAATVAP